MMFRRNALLPVAVLALAAACSDVSTPPTTTQGPTVQAQAPRQEGLATRIPGFGGYFLDHGIPTVYLTDVTKRGDVEAALGGFARVRGLGASDIRVIQGQYSYKDLDTWHRAVTLDAFEIPGVVYTDLDEASNRVVIGALPGSSVGRLHSLAAKLGVPAGAVEIREAEEMIPMATLRPSGVSCTRRVNCRALRTRSPS